ncbi:hypothetical protein ACH4A3_11705 [Streptomyces sp. NPDC018007]|uniref:hypothetical protein n=1 Tax=Streptomyces sp. NPDC018007 TaxID=3365029 RepID=UPI0037AF78DE
MSSEITADLAKRPLGCVGDFFDIGAGVTIDPGRVPKRETATYLRVANVQRGFIDLSALARVEKFPGDEAKYALREGDLLVVEGHANPREIGRCALVANGSVGHLHQNHLFRLRSANVIAEFSQFWLNSEHVRSYWRRAAATSSGLYTISRAVVENAPFPILRTGEQKGILARMGSFSEKIRSNVEELAKLRLLKAGLVDDLLSGRVAVSVADG